MLSCTRLADEYSIVILILTELFCQVEKVIAGIIFSTAIIITYTCTGAAGGDAVHIAIYVVWNWHYSENACYSQLDRS